MRGRALQGSLIAAAAAFFVALSPAASAHGDLQSTTPADGAAVKEPPGAVEIVFTEPPTNDSRFQVLDGCDRDVFDQASGQGAERRLALEGGEPGRWKVTYRVISAEDGHFTKGEFSFRVGGKRDCSTDDVGTPGPRETSDEAIDVLNGEEDTFPVVPLLIAGGAVIVLALAARFFSAR